ncbi:hypothetical protein [Dehalobacter sp. 14DCB1]|uniref:DUF7448 domain-containing protein n=1 Tax=Dehalobacter sp. 14DCB1 TaxID=2070227 RepID=UPI0010435BF6|nr:hypothetical protein [Dehalobacter sp. 14DCB1]TCX53813.1 hypothetical protein C1I36_03525 [Dehalobacter sp. 14DCB1]
MSFYEELKKQVLYKKIVEIKEYGDRYDDEVILKLNDGTVLKCKTNQGCGGCSNGWSSFQNLFNGKIKDNVITNITTSSSGQNYDDIVTVHVFFEEPQFNFSEDVDEGWGNGYYGGGFELEVIERGAGSESVTNS